MANRFIDGADYYNTTALGLQIGWTTMNVGINGAASTRFNKGQCLSGAGSGVLTKTLDNQATWIVGYACNFSTPAAGTWVVFSFNDGGTAQVALNLSNTGVLTFQRGAAVLGTYALPFTFSVWHYMEMKVTIHPTAGTFEVRLDGNPTPIIVGSGANTRSSGNNFASTLAWGFNNSSSSHQVDDVYINDGTGSAPDNDFWGDLRIDTQYPSGAGAHTAFTPSTGANWTTVDEPGAPNTTDFNSSSTVGAMDTFPLLPITSTSGTVCARKMSLYHRKTDAGFRQDAPVVRHSGTDNTGTALTIPSSFGYQSQVYPINPVTGVAWTVSDCNNDEVGYTVVA